MRSALWIAIVGIAAGGCYLSHERPNPSSWAGTDGGTCAARTGPYVGTLSIPLEPPELRFASPTSATSSFAPVAAPGRFLAAIDDNEGDTTLSPTVLVSFDREGHQQWRRDFGALIARPIVMRDGTILVMQPSARTLSVLDASGAVVGTHTIGTTATGRLWPLAVSREGRVVFGWTDFADSSEVIDWDPCAGERWRVTIRGALNGRAAFDLEGAIYVPAGESVHVIAPDGRVVAEHETGGFINSHPIYVSTMEIVVTSVVGSGADDATSATRIIAMRGTSARTFEVPGRWHPGRSALGNLPSMTVALRNWDSLVAFDLLNGVERWRSPLHPNLILELVGDQNDRLAVVSQSLFALEGATGRRLWSVDPPSGTACVDGLAFDDGMAASSQCDGTLFAVAW
jgi:outer membrane protein assembly factor BamB